MTPTAPNAPPSPVKPSALPLVALILGVVGFCVPPLFLVAIVLAIISLARGSEPAFAARKTLAIITLAFGVIYVPVVGILAAIAIPNFIRFQARSKQSECKLELKTAFTAQRSYFLENDKYTDSPTAMGFSPEPGRYLYLISLAGRLEPKRSQTPADKLLAGVPAELRDSLGVTGECPRCTVTMACAGNIDNDPTIDVWSVSSEPRVIRGEEVPAGVPWNEVNDVVD
ncbi:MAG: pilin [Myxococcota bacterium]